MLNKLDVVNDAINNSEQVDVGGSIGCFIACSGVCLITGMIGAPMAVAAMDLDQCKSTKRRVRMKSSLFNLEVVNEKSIEMESYDVGGNWACVIGCGTFCFLGGGSTSLIAAVTAAL